MFFLKADQLKKALQSVIVCSDGMI
ncbi:hypothetical protein PBAL39_22967 [Pedobacter sp. BAL39]|nr:hypothetical protein PBAL39_22967 [Pedobacter sp. BAL39]